MRARLEDDQIQVSFVQADPPRTSWLALWSDDPEARLEPTDSITIARPNPETGHVALRQTAVERVELSEVIETLAEAQTPHTEASGGSVWIEATRAALTIAASGRLKPGLSNAGYDAWQFGPLLRDEEVHIDSLAQAMPPAGHSHVDNDGFTSAPPPDEAPSPANGQLDEDDDRNVDAIIAASAISVATPNATVRSFMQAIIDRFTRPTAAAMVAGHDAFAVGEPVVIDSGAALRRLSALSGERAPLTTLRIKVPSDDAGDQAIVGTLVFQSRLDPTLTVPAASLWAAPEATRKSLSLIHI